MVFKEAIKQFNNWRALKVKRIDGYDLDLKQFCIFVKNKEIENVNINEVVEWLSWYKELGFEPWTVLKKAMALRKFFEYYGRLKYEVIDWWLIPLPPKDQKMPRVCTEENYRQLLSVIPKEGSNHIRNLCMISMIWDTGMRLGECVGLNLDNLNLKNSEIIIKTGKSRGVRPFRKLPFSKETLDSVISWVTEREKMIAGAKEIRDQEALFLVNQTKSGNVLKRIETSAFGDIMRKYSNKAGLESINPHSFRHHFGTELAKSGYNNSVISEALGHASLQSSYRYTQINNDELSGLLKKRLTKKLSTDRLLT